MKNKPSVKEFSTEFDTLLDYQEAQIIDESTEEYLLDRRMQYVAILIANNQMSSFGALQSWADSIFDQAQILVYKEISAKREKEFLTECKLMIAERSEECTSL